MRGLHPSITIFEQVTGSISSFLGRFGWHILSFPHDPEGFVDAVGLQSGHASKHSLLLEAVHLFSATPVANEKNKLRDDLDYSVWYNHRVVHS